MTKVSFVTCVNNFEKYNACVRNSLKEQENFGRAELIAVDNTTNQFSIPQALNLGIKKASGDILVCCHHDVEFSKDWIPELLSQIAAVERLSPNWGVLGTFGVDYEGMQVGNILDQGIHYKFGSLPYRVQSLDEHCLILNRRQNLHFDETVGGYHLYGADICLQALSRGLDNFAIDACLHHKSEGEKKDASFYDAMSNLHKKWRHQKPPLSVVETTCGVVRLKSGLKSLLLYKYIKRRRKKIKRKLCQSQSAILLDLNQKPTWYFQSVRKEMLKYIPPQVKRVLEFGCGAGGFSVLVKQTTHAEAWAVEMDASAARDASKVLDRVFTSDATQAMQEIPDNYFDCIIMLDLLEHLHDPYTFLVGLKKKLTSSGVIATSIPNVRYYRNYIEFAIRGNWDYVDAGILDKTHLRFFTYKSILKTFHKLEYEVVKIEGINGTRNKKLKFLNWCLFNRIRDLRYLQFAVVAKPK